jgi:anti-sigma factor RsiW
MSCTDLRELLTAFVYGDVSPQLKAAAADHLAACPRCREEQSALMEVRRLLDAAPAPNFAVDVGRVYEQAARQRQQYARRWRRAAMAAAGVAAALLMALALRLEVRWESHQLVLRWGLPPVAEPQAPPVAEALVVPRPPAEVTAADLRLVKDLIHALAATVDERDAKLQQLEMQLSQVQEQARTRWDATERYVSALHTSQLDVHTKGEK